MSDVRKSVKIGNTSFRTEAIKKMKLKEFEDTYSNILKGKDLKAIYDQIVAGPTSTEK